MKTASAALLPRVIYAGDVPVEASVAGSLLLYRLLTNYPAERLCVWESNLQVSRPERRLPNVEYGTFFLGWERLLRTRLRAAYSCYLALGATHSTGALIRAAVKFGAEAILTVSHGYGWLAAAEAARRLHLPLHLISHDDWPSMIALPHSMRPWAQRRFGRIYRQAASRLCVSPAMQQQYGHDHGVEGEVLYPSRAANAPDFLSAPPAPSEHRATVFAYAGSVYAPGLSNALRDLAVALDGIDARLEIYAGLAPDSVTRMGLDRANVVIRPFLPSNHLIETLRREADVMFLPMSFAPADQPNARICFPTKFTDYTSTGLPMLVYGPPDCSAVRWTEERPGLAETVSRREDGSLPAAVKRLVADGDHRARLGTAALESGARYFSHAAVTSIFYRSLMSARRQR